jgi:hypothetical protein
MIEWVENMGNISELIKNICKKHNIQFRKMDVRRSENITLGINFDCLKRQKRILISYLDYDRTAYSVRYANGHTNLQEMFQLIKVLIDMDFCIDVCGCNNEDAAREMPSDYYDYILGFGDMFKLAKKKNPKAYTIIYMTENPYTISCAREQERIDYFYERTGKHISFERTGKYYQKNDECGADAIICLGESYYFKTGNVHRIYPTAFKNEKYISNIHQNKSSANFIVFGVKGFVHKGNDLLVEVFERHPEWKLYMCGNGIEDECKKLAIKLPANVIDCGFVDVNSDKYITLVKQCRFMLLPSCSEGMSTAILTCMRHGIIPVTMKGTGMNEMHEYCEYFEGYQISDIENKLIELASSDNRKLEQWSDKIYKYANDTFTLEKYTNNIRNCLKNILNDSAAFLK